ncbi:hypothetical protein COCOBI_17-3280 [Coccomyxa sp. Obi]|nr:hypothetical protein COCOBI_17-3280 [Coccomyxa sp. Obi]
MALRKVAIASASAVVLGAALLQSSIFQTVEAAPSPPAPCGTLDLTSPLTQHCFPADGSHHFVCCDQIQMPENPHSPHGNYNPLERVIKAASNESNYSWCTCSEEICTEQLHGRVAWNMNGVGWKGYLPPSAAGGSSRGVNGLSNGSQ